MAQQFAQKPRKLANEHIPVYRRSPWMILHAVNPLTRLVVGWLGLDDHY